MPTRRAVVTWVEMIASVPSPDVRRAVVTWAEMILPPVPDGAYTAVEVSTTSAWAVRSAVTPVSRVTEWQVRFTFEEEIFRLTLWRVRSAVTPVSSSAEWQVRTIVTPISRATEWQVRTAVTPVTRNTAWHILSYLENVAITRSSTWRVRTALLPVTRSSTWHVHLIFSFSARSEWGQYRYERDRLTFEFLPTHDKSSEFIHGRR